MQDPQVQQVIGKLQQEEIAKIEKILKDLPEGHRPFYKIAFDSTIKEKVVIDPETTFPFPKDLFDEPVNILEELVTMKSELRKQLASIDRELLAAQIITSDDMKGFGFYRVTGGDTYDVYRIKDAFSRGWEVLLNITNPNKVKIGKLSLAQEPKLRESFTYTIKTLEEFRTLLIQLELI